MGARYPENGLSDGDALKKLAPGKFFNDLCGFNKKNKLGLKAPSMEEVKHWCGAAE